MKRKLLASFGLSLLSIAAISSAPSQAAPVTPAQWFNSQPAPVFKPGNTLPRLTRFGWSLPLDANTALAENWNYALQLPTYLSENERFLDRLNDPNDEVSKIVALTNSNPTKYPLSVIVSRDDPASVDYNTYLRDSNGNLISGTTYSPLNPQWVIDSMAELRARPLRVLRAKVPINIILNGGEYGVGPLTENRNQWYTDPKVNSAVAAAGGDLFDFQSKAKANESNTIFNAVASAVPDRGLYIYYNSGNQDRNRYYTWKDYSLDGQYTRHQGDLQSEEYYYKEQNDGWLPGSFNNDELTRALNAKGFALSGTGQTYEKFNYDWLCSGFRSYDPVGHFSPMNTYTGFLKCLFTMGTIGGNAGYYEEPPGGFEASFDSAAPQQWAQQMARLSHVQALFSYLESDVRNSDLLPGPNMHVMSNTQPAYEFPTGSPGARVVARKVTGQNKWLITAWAADGVDRPVQVAIPVLGYVELSARAAGSVYIATLVNNQIQLMMTDPDAMTPTVGGYAPVNVPHTPNPNPAFVNGGFETPVLSGGYTAFVYNPTFSGWTFAANSGIQRNGSAYNAANAPEGSQTAFLQSNGNVGAMRQIVSFDAGTYKLQFQAARRSGQVQPIQIKIDGTNVGSTITPSSNSFAVYNSAEFTVIAGSHEITLAASDASGDSTSFVDDVRIVVVAPAAPPGPLQPVDGSFELPTATGGFLEPGGSSWTFVSGGNLKNGSYYGNPNAPAGVQCAGLQNNGGVGSISQSFAWNAGTYKVTFQSANRSGQSNPVQLTIDGTNIGSPISPTGTSFGLSTSASFTVTAGSHTLKFQGTTTSGDNTAFIDDVRIVVDNSAGPLQPVDGSFELPTATGGFLEPGGSSWTFVSGGNLKNGSYYGNPNALAGVQCAGLQNNGGLASISQSFAWNAGTYKVTFQMAGRNNNGTQILPLQLTIDGTNIGSPISPTGTSFASFTSASFTVTAGSHTLKFQGTTTSGDNTAFIDDVRIVIDNSPAMPAMEVHGSGTLPDGSGIYDYGTVNVNAPLDHIFTISNTGSGTLNLTGSPRAVISGTNAADFSVTVQPAATVAAAGSATFTVRFTPSAAGTRTATVSIASNDAATSPYTFNVTGSGLSVPLAPSTLAATRPANRQINLTWKDNSGNESGFKIERATNSTFTTNLVQVATTAANVVTYSNTGLAANTRYYYRIRATNAAGNSAFSNVVNALTGA